MKSINSLYSREGRRLLCDIFNELRFEKQYSSLKALLLCWRIATKEREIKQYTSYEIVIENPLGFFKGTKIWLEEVVNRFYFSTINSLVYFGAAILLVLIGLRRFSDISDTLVIAGVIFEALMLIFMFVIMLFTPTEDYLYKEGTKNGQVVLNGVDSYSDLKEELGEISSDFAGISFKLGKISENLESFIQRQEEIISSMRDTLEKYAELNSPNPQVLQSLNETNAMLSKFNESIEHLMKISENLKNGLIEQSVRQEFEKLLESLAKTRLNNENE